MKIAVVGTGAMGSVYAGLLASDGNEVWAVDTWEEHIDAIRRHGLRVSGASGDRTVSIGATTQAEEVGTVDLVVVATKAMDVEEAARAALALLGPDTIVLPIQNGLGSSSAAAAVIGEERVLLGVAGGFGASVVAPGWAHHEGMELLRLGELRGPITERLERIAETWRAAGFTVQTYDDIDRLVWEKLICNVCFSGPCAVLDASIGEVMADANAWAVATGCAVEAYDVGRAIGVDLAFDDPVAHARAFGLSIPNAYPSLLLDLRAGRRTEIAFINGAIPRVGRTVGVAAPVNETVAALVNVLESRIAAAK
jgi:2-dehydropantoate 2-reductase